MGKIELNTYLFFAGSAREAMEFYKSIFGGDVTDKFGIHWLVNVDSKKD
jgi:uncharacterized glyoxalase superfamily protein PhnB